MAVGAHRTRCLEARVRCPSTAGRHTSTPLEHPLPHVLRAEHLRRHCVHACNALLSAAACLPLMSKLGREDRTSGLALEQCPGPPFYSRRWLEGSTVLCIQSRDLEHRSQSTSGSLRAVEGW